MQKVARRILKTLLVVVVVLVVLVVGVILFLGPIIKTAAEKIGPKVLGVPVTVESVSVRVFSGSFGLKNLRVGNPANKGYSSDPLLAMGELRVAVKLGSLPGKGPIGVSEVTILNPTVSYEVVKGESNVDSLLKNMQGSKPSIAETPPKKEEAARTEPPKTAEKKESRKVIIDRFEFRSGEVSFRAAITLQKAVTVPLPPIVATDIGKSSGGTSTEEAVNRMFLEVASGVTKAVVGITDAIGSGAKAGEDAVKARAKGMQDAVKGLF